MNLVHLSPHFPAHYGLFTERLAQLGVKVFGITDCPAEALSPRLRAALSSHYRVESLHRTDQVIEACRHFEARFGSIDRIESHLEPWVELEGKVRDALSIPGFKSKELAFLKRKSLMKAVYDKARVPVARGTVVESLEQCLGFIRGNYPVFIKPDTGVGAADTYTIRCEADLRRFFQQKSSYPYFMEEYLDGVIESFDGLTDSDGNVVFFTSHVFSDDIHKVVAKNENLAYWSVREIPADLAELGHRVVAAANIREKFFHLEFFRLADGSLRGLEINLRPPGGLSTHMFDYACDIDVYDWWAHIVAGQPYAGDFQRRYHCAFVGRKHDRAYRYSHEQLVGRLGAALVLTQPMSAIEYAVMGNQGYLVRAERFDVLQELMGEILAEA